MLIETKRCREQLAWFGVMVLVWLAGSVALAAAAPSSTAEVDGFTEPYRTHKIATSEMGIVVAMEVREGENITVGQVVARLDSELQEVLLALAKKSLESKGRLESAQAELVLHSERLAKFKELLAKGHARQEEVDRTRADVAIAEAHVLAAEEESALRQLEYDKTAIQLNRRVVTSPVAGAVAAVLKTTGEFVAPTDPYLVEIVELDRLIASFSILSQQAAALRPDQKVAVRLADSGEMVEGSLEFLAPVTDAESGTVRVKVRLENADGRHRSGQRCALLLADPPTQ